MKHFKETLKTYFRKILLKKDFIFAKILVNFKRTYKLFNIDYGDLRLLLLELCASEIYEKNIKGNVAELGVYRADFAKYINLAFYDRKLYLFDTFEGFIKDDIEYDKKLFYSSRQHDFTDTNIDLIMNRMKIKENVIIKKGYFPESASGVDESFVFVSIDVDLYKPVYAGLAFFYPKLSKGGYIFVHDYNNDIYKGAKEAVRDFCEKYNVPYTPYIDIGGTVVISK